MNNFVINNCGDVDTTTASPVFNDALVWDGTNWVPDNTVRSGININATLTQNNKSRLDNLVVDNCTDVDTTTVAPGGDLLMYDSTDNKWKPDTTLVTSVNTNTTNIQLNTNAIEELRIKTGEQLTYEVQNVTVGTGAVIAGNMFVNNSVPSLVTGISLSTTDKNGVPINQPYAVILYYLINQIIQ